MPEDPKAEGIGEDQSAPASEAASEDSILDVLRDAMSGDSGDEPDDEAADDAPIVAEIDEDDQDDEPEPQARQTQPKPKAQAKPADAGDAEDDDDPVLALDPAYVAKALKHLSMDDIRGYAKRDPEYLIRLVDSFGDAPAKAEQPTQESWTKAVIDAAMDQLGDEFDEDQKDAIRKSHEALLRGIEGNQTAAQARQQQERTRAELLGIVNKYDANLEKIDPKGEIYGSGPSLNNKNLGRRAFQRRENLYEMARWFESKGLAKSGPEALEMAHAGLNHKRIEQRAATNERTRIRESATRRARSVTTAGSQKPSGTKPANSDEAALSELRSVFG